MDPPYVLRHEPNEYVRIEMQFAQNRILRQAGVIVFRLHSDFSSPLITLANPGTPLRPYH
jgi:hypothetical protein